MPAHVFLSYSHQDKSEADKLQAAIEDTGLSVWRDVDPNRIRGGEAFWDVIESAIKSVGCLVIILSRRSEHSDAVKREFTLAHASKTPIIPVLIDATGPHELDLWWRERISDIHCESARSNDQARAHQRIVEAAKFYGFRRCQVIGLFNMKGGVGKTTLATQLAARLNVAHKRHVLMVDVDPQQNLTDLLFTKAGLDRALKCHNSLIGLLEPTKIGKPDNNFGSFHCDPTPSDAVDYSTIPFPLHQQLLGNRFDCIPSDMRAIKYTNAPQVAGFCEANFSRALEALKRFYDYIILDCNPSVSFLTGMALKACNNILIPIKPDIFAYSGLQFTEIVLNNFFDQKQKILDGGLKLSAILNEVSPDATKTHDEGILIEEIRSNFRIGNFLSAQIPSSDAMKLKSEGALQNNPDDLLAHTIIRKVSGGRSEGPLQQMVNEYVGGLEGYNKPEHKHDETASKNSSGQRSFDDTPHVTH